MFARREEIQPLGWTEFIPPVNPDVDYGEFEIYGIAPLDSGTLWISFDKVDTNSTYTLTVGARWPDGMRKVTRADITFSKPKPGWPMCLLVNEEPQRFDGLLDVGFKIYPFERVVRIVQTRGVAKPLRFAALTGVYESPSVSA